MPDAEDHPERLTRLELLKATIGDARDLVPNYIRGYSVYVAITGGLLKFAFDVDATATLRQLLALFGLLLSFLGVFVCWLGELTFRNLTRDAKALCHALDVEPVPSFAKSLRYLAIISCVFAVIVMAGWIYVLLHFC